MCAFNVGHIPCASYLRVERLLRQNSEGVFVCPEKGQKVY